MSLSECKMIYRATKLRPRQQVIARMNKTRRDSIRTFANRHRPIPTQQANANASPTLANRHLHPSEAHAQTHRSAGRMPQPCHATSNANHTHKQTLVPPMQAKLHCRRSRAWPNDKTHDANCRHQPMTMLDLRTFCNVRL